MSTFPGFTASAALAPHGGYGGTLVADGPGSDVINPACGSACCAMCTRCVGGDESACSWCRSYCPAEEAPGVTRPVYLTR